MHKCIACSAVMLVLIGMRVSAVERQTPYYTDGKVTRVTDDGFTLKRTSGKVTTFTWAKKRRVKFGKDGKASTRKEACKVGMEVRVWFFVPSLECFDFGAFDVLTRPPPKDDGYYTP